MRIMLIGDRMESLNQVRNYSGMWSWYLALALEKRGHQVLFGRRFRADDDIGDYTDQILADAWDCEAIIALGVRYFDRLPLEVAEILQDRFHGPLAQIQDGPAVNGGALHVDLALSVRDGPHSIGWAADPELYYPAQSGDCLDIFIDHANFGLSGWDYSYSILRNLEHVPVPYRAWTLTDEGIERAFPGTAIRPYRRSTIPAQVLASALRASDIFIATHPESVGQTVLEASMCGAMVLAPPHCLPVDRIETIDHHYIGPRIQWDTVIRSLDAQRTHKRASAHIWDRVAQRMLEHLAAWSP